jgi:integrase
VSPHAVAAIKLLIFTGARLGEVLGLRWEWLREDGASSGCPTARAAQRRCF